MRAEDLSKRICPRCGLKYSWIERKRVGYHEYFYAVHIDGPSRKKCYLGPKTYENVTKLHYDMALVLRGLLERDRAVEYLEILLVKVRREVSEGKVVDHEVRRLLALAKRLVEACEERLKAKEEAKEAKEEDVLSRFPPILE